MSRLVQVCPDKGEGCPSWFRIVQLRVKDVQLNGIEEQAMLSLRKNGFAGSLRFRFFESGRLSFEISEDCWWTKIRLAGVAHRSIKRYKRTYLVAGA